YSAHLGIVLAGSSWRTFAAALRPVLALSMLIGLPVAVATAALRAWSFAPQVTLVLSTLAILPSLVAVVCLPKIFLGDDGQWMAGKLVALLFPLVASRS